MDVYNITDGSAKKPVEPEGGRDAGNAAYLKKLGDWQKVDIKAQRYIVTSVNRQLLQKCVKSY